jgi:hypothetical protein
MVKLIRKRHFCRTGIINKCAYYIMCNALYRFHWYTLHIRTAITILYRPNNTGNYVTKHLGLMYIFYSLFSENIQDLFFLNLKPIPLYHARHVV